jgi:hypothetical protein
MQYQVCIDPSSQKYSSWRNSIILTELLYVSWVPLDKVRGWTSNYVTTPAFHILPNSLLTTILTFDTVQPEVLQASLNKSNRNKYIQYNTSQ